jgi:hypothetical protein
MARVVGAFDRKESEYRSCRIKVQKRQRARDGRRVSGGRRAYGFSTEHTQIQPDEAAMIQETALRALAGESICSIFADLNERRVPRASEGPWPRVVLDRILTSGAVSAQVEHLGENVSIGDWLAILSPAIPPNIEGCFSNDRGGQPRSSPLSARGNGHLRSMWLQDGRRAARSRG